MESKTIMAAGLVLIASAWGAPLAAQDVSAASTGHSWVATGASAKTSSVTASASGPDTAIAGMQTALPTQGERWQTKQTAVRAANVERGNANLFVMKPRTSGTALRIPALAALPYIASHSRPFAADSDPARAPGANQTGLINTIADGAH